MSRVPLPLRHTLFVGLLLSGTGCRAATLAYGPDVASARVNAEAFADALEQRFTRVVRLPKFLYARMRMGRFALSPSKLVNDTALWTSERSTRVGAERDLEVAGTVIGGRYTFSPRAQVASPVRTGDSRHFIGLVQLPADNDWQWTTKVENAVGGMPPARATDIMRALFLSAERPATDIRADYRSALPRTTTALGRLLLLDSLSTDAQPDGSTRVSMHIHISGDSLQGEFPEMSKYVRKYLAPARFHFRLSDKVGADWFDVQSRKSRLVMRFRTRGGELQPLEGPPRRMPDTLVLHADASAKISFFTVGASNVVGEFVHVSTSTQREWAMRFTKEPDWDLPLLTEQLLNTPLKRPFEGGGAQFRIGFIRGADGQTLLARTMVLAVRESAIMRFLGNLGFTAMSDYAGRVEDEENRFLAELFAAMRADVRSLK
ncbi:MAG: hypothetical protein IPP90_04750 [Gemmatimonadaceae bacterium]|nr:hypothetical protein [Gemmatimonadaceae bacterium]